MVVEQVEWPSMSQINQGYHLPTGQPTTEVVHPLTIQPTTMQQPPTHLGAVHPPTLQHPRGGRGVSPVTL